MACEGLRQQLAVLRDLELQTQADAREATGVARTELLQQLKQIKANIAAVQRNLAACLATPSRLPAKAAEQILSLVYENPAFTGTGDWAKPIAGGTFPNDTGGFEWKQVLAPGDEQEDNVTLVGASGWVFGPSIAGSDFFFSHPFGSDWEFLMALDKPPDNLSKYTFLLAPGNAPAAPPAGQQPKDTSRAR